jgi:hypothetical protein
MCGADTNRVFAFSLADEILSATQSESLAARPLAGVVAPLTAGAATGTFHLYVLCADGAIREIDPDLLWLLDVFPLFGAIEQGAMAVGYWGIYTSSDRPGEIVFFDEILGAPAGRVLVPNRGYWKFITVIPEDGIDTLYAVDTDGRWSVLQQTGADGLQLVPEAAIADTPNVIDVRTSTEYDHWSTGTAVQFAALTCGPEGRGKALYFSTATRRSPALTAVSLAYAPYQWQDTAGALATARAATLDDAAQFPELPWWHPVQLASLRDPTFGNPLDGIVALAGQRSAWVTDAPTTAPSFGPPAPASPAPTCTLACAATTPVASVVATAGWAVGLDALPIQSANIYVTGASTATVPVAAPGAVTVPLANVGAHTLTLQVLDRFARLATATAPCTRSAVLNPYLLPSSWSGGNSFMSVYRNSYAKLWLDGFRTGALTFDPTSWKLVFMGSASPLYPPDTAATYADIAAWELVGGTYPTGGVAVAATVTPEGLDMRCYGNNAALNILLPAGAPGDLARIAILDSADRLVAWSSNIKRTFYGGSTIADLYGADSGDLFFHPGPTLLNVYSYADPTTVVNDQDFDTNPPTVTLDMMSGVTVVRSVSGVLVYHSQSQFNPYQTILRRYTMPLLSVPVYPTDPTGLYILPRVTSRPLDVASDLAYPIVGYISDPSVYTSMDVVANTYIDLLLPGRIP